MTPPGFDALTSDLELATTIGHDRFGALLMIALNASEQADLPGGWAVVAGVEQVGGLLGLSKPGALKVLRDLEAYGLIRRIQGRNLGRGMGSLPSRIWMTYNPHLASPSDDPETTETLSPSIRTPSITRSLIAVDNSSSVPSFPLGNDQESFDNKNVSAVMSDHSSSFMSHDNDMMPLESCPGPLKQALQALGWNGDVPRGDPEVITVLAQWVVRQPSGRFKKPAAWLRAVLRKPGEAPKLVAELGLLQRSENLREELSKMPDIDGVMSLSEYQERCIQDSRWEAIVNTEARRRANEQGVHVSMLMIRAVAFQYRDRSPDALTQERFG